MSTVSPPAKLIQLTIDGRTVAVSEGTTIYDAARMHGIYIPILCHQENETPVGICRLCVVDTKTRAYAASCVAVAEAGMEIETSSPPVIAARKTILELLMADHNAPCARQKASKDCELENRAGDYAVGKPRFPRRGAAAAVDDSSASIAVDLNACILCDRCIRGCAEIRNNFVIARQGKGYEATIAFDSDTPMGSSSCVSCGECMVSCPTGALTNKQVAGQALEGEPVSSKEILGLPVFHGVSGTFLELNQGAIVRREVKAGEILFREGDYGSSAFYILQGKVEVFIASPTGHVNTRATRKSLFRLLSSHIVDRRQDQREEENLSRQSIFIDAPVDLSYEDPVAELGAGELFGEMTCMSFYPRSATVRAKTDCVMLEMLRNVLDVLQKNKTFRAQLDHNYRQRALESHLRSVPIFAGLSSEFIDHLRPRVDLVRCAPNEIIFRQGDAADAFYLVRQGFVKVSESHPGGEIVLNYLSKGNYFGEIGLLGDAVRSATCTALDNVDLVRISAEDFRMMLEYFPAIRSTLEEVAAERMQENAARYRSASNVPIDDFLHQGLMNAQSLLVLDLDRCTRCDLCVKACADAHDGVTRLIRDGLRFDKYLVATSCRQCRDPLCMVGCPVGAIRRRNSLEVIIEDWCIGCGICANNCPYGNINMHEFVAEGTQILEEAGRSQQQLKKARIVRKATSCNLCQEHDEPNCVYACPHDAAHRVNPNEFFAGILGRKQRSREET